MPLSSRRYLSPYPDEEEERRLWQSIGRSGLSAISGIGNLLELPGSMIRDVATLNNPLDQLLDPFGRDASQNRISGRDVLTKWGLADKNRETGIGGWFDDPLEGVADIAGFGLEVGLDPLAWFGGPIARGAAKGLKATGRAASKIPYVGAPVASAARRAGREGRRLFDYSVSETELPTSQATSVRMWGNIAADTPKLKKFTGKILEDLHKTKFADEPKFIRKVFEGVEEAPPELKPIYGKVRLMLNGLLGMAQEKGYKLADLEEKFIKYFPRFKTTTSVSGQKGYKQAFVTGDPSQIQRHDWTKNIKGGTEQIKDILADASVGQARIKFKGSKDIKGFSDVIEASAPGAIEKGMRHKFAKEVMEMDDDVFAAGLFGNHPIVDLQIRGEAALKAFHGEDATFGYLTDYLKGSLPGAKNAATYNSVIKHSKSGITKPLTQVIDDANLIPETVFKRISKEVGIDVDAVRNISIPKEMADDLGRIMKGFTAPDAIQGVRQAALEAMAAWKTGQTGLWPAFHSRNLVGAQFNNWLARMFSGQSVKEARELLHGVSPKGLKDISEVKSRLMEEGISITDESAANMMRRMVSEHDLVRGQGIVADISGDVPASAGLSDMMESMPGGFHGEKPFSWRQTGKEWLGLGEDTTWNPMEMFGKESKKGMRWGPAKAGQDLGNYVEGLSRIAPFIHQLRKGVPSLEAAQKVRAAQVDYSSKAYTEFEKTLSRWIFPFYKFTRGQLPYQLGQIVKNPGGRLAQTLRATRLAGTDDPSVPEFISEGAAIPLGELGDKTQRFVTGLGLMHEGPFGLVSSNVGQGLRSLGSMLSPAIKGPIEWMTGESLFQSGPTGGRALANLDPAIGRLLSNIGNITGMTDRKTPVQLPRGLEYLSSMGPWARGVTTLRQLTDPRKYEKGFGLPAAANFLTGLKISDVSPSTQARVKSDELNKLIMEGFPESRVYEQAYIPDDPNATPEKKKQLEQMTLLRRFIARQRNM